MWARTRGNSVSAGCRAVLAVGTVSASTFSATGGASSPRARRRPHPSGTPPIRGCGFGAPPSCRRRRRAPAPQSGQRLCVYVEGGRRPARRRDYPSALRDGGGCERRARSLGGACGDIGRRVQRVGRKRSPTAGIPLLYAAISLAGCTAAQPHSPRRTTCSQPALRLVPTRPRPSDGRGRPHWVCDGRCLEWSPRRAGISRPPAAELAASRRNAVEQVCSASGPMVVLGLAPSRRSSGRSSLAARCWGRSGASGRARCARRFRRWLRGPVRGRLTAERWASSPPSNLTRRPRARRAPSFGASRRGWMSSRSRCRGELRLGSDTGKVSRTQSRLRTGHSEASLLSGAASSPPTRGNRRLWVLGKGRPCFAASNLCIGTAQSCGRQNEPASWSLPPREPSPPLGIGASTRSSRRELS